MEGVFQTLNAALHPPVGWACTKSTLLTTNTPNTSACISARTAEALALKQVWNVSEFTKEMGASPEEPEGQALGQYLAGMPSYLPQRQGPQAALPQPAQGGKWEFCRNVQVL